MQEKNYNNKNDIQNKIFLDILSSYVSGVDVHADSSIIDWNIDWKYISSLAMEQGLGGMLYKAVQNNSIVDREVFKKLEYYYQKSLFMCAARNELIVKISKLFENSGIDFIILKGAVLQSFYPSPELRVMSDIDFLIKPEQRKNVKILLESNEIKFKESNSYQDIYISCNGVLIEIHHALWGYNLEQTELYSNIWSNENLISGLNHTFLFSDEDLYIFTIAHMFKHFKDSGIGIRPVFDIWYILNKTISHLDFSYITNELSKFGADEFEKKIRMLVNCIFLGNKKNGDVYLIEKYLLRCQTHGNDEVAAINQARDKSKTENFLFRVFPPLSYMKRRYSLLDNLPFLLPLFWFIRILSLLFKKDRLNQNLNKVKSNDEDEKKFINDVFVAAGIKK